MRSTLIDDVGFWRVDHLVRVTIRPGQNDAKGGPFDSLPKKRTTKSSRPSSEGLNFFLVP